MWCDFECIGFRERGCSVDPVWLTQFFKVTAEEFRKKTNKERGEGE